MKVFSVYFFIIYVRVQATSPINSFSQSNYPDPDSKTAMAVGLDSDDVSTSLKYSIGPQV